MNKKTKISIIKKNVLAYENNLGELGGDFYLPEVRFLMKQFAELCDILEEIE